MNEYYLRYKKTLHKLVLSIIFIAGVIIFFQYLFTYIAPFVIGWILSYIYNPLINFLNNKFKVPRGIGAFISILLLLVFFSSVVAGFISRLSHEAALFYNQLPKYIENLHYSLIKFDEKLNEILSILPNGFTINTDNTNLWDLAASILKNNSSGSIHFVMGIPNALVIVIISLLSSFFYAKDKYYIDGFVSSHTPPALHLFFLTAKGSLGEALWGYVKSQLILMVFTFIICITGLLILGSPYAFLISVIISIIDALPFFGSGFILWPWAVIQLLMGNTFLAVGYIIIYLIITLIRQILQPKILGTQIGLHPLITLISMYIGLKFIGVLGMIIGPIIAVMIKTIHEIYIKTLSDNTFDNKNNN